MSSTLRRAQQKTIPPSMSLPSNLSLSHKLYRSVEAEIILQTRWLNVSHVRVMRGTRQSESDQRVVTGLGIKAQEQGYLNQGTRR